MEKIKFTTTLNTGLIESMKIQAVKEKTSVSAMIERLAKEYLQKVGK